ncbi:hypothetical protein [Bradyrhizobium sp. SRS-191]|uniref:hypothetical protein n=1 Tax=Bradyrhizobium sp. SRS-191 TaxID=2962606 RepID=UPI00211DEA48|nr:hypothetical protein [Bradyrhizobium sp. SRS-191]
MRYVKIKPRADAPRSPCGRLIFIECGEPCADGHKPHFILHEGEDLCIPAWAAAELEDRGHEILEVNEIRDGAHVALDGVTVEQVDIVAEIGAMPDHEVDRFLRHHGFHDHLAVRASPPVRSNLKGLTASLGQAFGRVAAAPGDISAGDLSARALRAKALELHHARQARRRSTGKTEQKGRLK